MFSIPLTSDSSNYDFEKEDNAAKWKGFFVNSLRKVYHDLQLSLTLNILIIFHLFFLPYYLELKFCYSKTITYFHQVK